MGFWGFGKKDNSGDGIPREKITLGDGKLGQM